MPVNSEDLKRSVDLPNLKRSNAPHTVQNPHPEGSPDRHATTIDQARNGFIQDQALTHNRTRDQLQGLNANLQKIKGDRQVAIEQVSDTLAYLYSPVTFQNEVMQRTREKLGLLPEEETQNAQTVDLGSLGDVFSTFAQSVEYPAISPSTAMGCLPM